MSNPIPDAEGGRHRGPLPSLQSFTRAAQFLASDPESGLLIFSRFHELSIRNLLYLEARVEALKGVQRELDAQDAGNSIIPRAAGSWEQFALLGTGSGQLGDGKIPSVALAMWRRSTKEGPPSQSRQEDGEHNLTCDERTLKAIQDRWEVALAIQDAVKDYRTMRAH
jgi:hypothetical protein